MMNSEPAPSFVTPTLYASPAAGAPRRPASPVLRPSAETRRRLLPGDADSLSLHRMHSHLDTHQKPQAQLRVERQSRVDALRHEATQLLGGAALNSFRRAAAIGTAAVALATIILAPVTFFASFPAAVSGIIAAGLFLGIALAGLAIQVVSRWRHLRKISPETKKHLMAVAQELEDLSRPGAYEEDARARRKEITAYIATLPETERYAAQMHLMPQYQSNNYGADVEADKKQHKQVIDLINALHGGFGWHVAEFFLGIADVGHELRETIGSLQKKWSKHHTQKHRNSMALDKAPLAS